MKIKLNSIIVLIVATNSFSLSFSKNYIVTGSSYTANSDTLTLYNNSKDTITIDTIFEELAINGQKINDYAEISFNYNGTDPGFYYLNFWNKDDSVFYTCRKGEFDKKHLIIKANDSICLDNFIFGKRIWCVGYVSKPFSSKDTFDITIRFKYDNTLSDSVVFHGPSNFFFSSTIEPRHLSKDKKISQNNYFDLLGRVYDKIGLNNNRFRIIKVLNKK